MGRAGLFAALVLAAPLSAQTPTKPEHHFLDPLKFVMGAAFAFAGHESGHVGFDLAFGAHPYVEKVHFGPIPFFSVAQRDPVTPGQEYLISSGGFLVQNLTNEIILTTHPRLRGEHHPMMKGAFTFNVALSLGYGLGALLEVGPPERDPRSMASSSGVAEPLIGLMVMTPALLDAYRYRHPRAWWAAWMSRAAKVGSVALVLRAASQ